jgi:hypothetical protein
MVMRLTRVHGLLVSCTKPSSVLERVSDGMYVLISQSLLYTSLPSAKIDRSKLSYLSADQQQELLEILDEFAECFVETPGFCYVHTSVYVEIRSGANALNIVSLLTQILSRRDCVSIASLKCLNPRFSVKLTSC